MCENNNGNTPHKNPFFEPYGTPHDTVPFDKIRLEDFEEAFMEGIRRDNEQIEKTVNNPEKPTFDNTIINSDDDKEGYYDLLSRVSAVFFNLLSAETNDEMDALAQKMQPILTKHANDVRLNPRLFERVRHVYRHHRKLTQEEKMLLDSSYDGFVRSGALLDDEGKEKLRKLTEEAGMLSLQFSQNLLKENKAFKLHITDSQQLDGLPETAIEAAAAEASEEGKEGWVFTLDYPSYSPFMTYSTQRELRERMYMAKNTECTHDNPENNIDICKRLINLRLEIARLLGYKSYADYVLKHRMAGSTKNVYKLLDDLIEAYKPTAEKEMKDLTLYAKKQEGIRFWPQPWDFSYYSHKLQLKKYNIDSEMLRPYLELSNVIKGVFGLATRLYGITFRENADIPVYHPDVKAYEVFDADGSYLAVLYADFFPRKGKQGGAWMTQYQGQWIDRKGTNVRPHVSIVMNLTKPTAEKPALLTLGEVETFLHEFGHALHGMFANTRFESLSGTNVWWDFVELPSQFMENYAVQKDFLNTFALHYKTGEPMPEHLREMQHSKYISLLPPMLSEPGGKMLPDSVYNERTHTYIPAAYASLTVSVDSGSPWTRALLGMLVLIANIWALVVFIRLVISINKSDIFCWRNVRRLRRLGVLLVVAWTCAWLSEWIELQALRQALSIPHYELAMTDAVDRISLLLGLCALIVGEVFAIGLRMKEEQDLTI